MIGWIEGTKIDSWEDKNAVVILLSCHGIGYEIQILPRQEEPLSKSQKNIVLWIHQVNREDQVLLFGFKHKKERDLFRKLISISGVGPQMAIALLEKLEVNELLTALIHKDISQLSQAKGIGKRVAEKLSLELSDKLQGLVKGKETSINYYSDSDNLDIENVNELKNSLKALGYREHEIIKAFQLLEKKSRPDFEKSKLSVAEQDELMKECLILLSQDS